MEPNNLHLLYHSDFVDTNALQGEPIISQYLWWALMLIELLLITRLALEFTHSNLTNPLTNSIYTFTQYLLYPFRFLFGNPTASIESNQIIVVAMVAYVVIVAILSSIIRAHQSPRSRIEEARALSRRKYTS